jgi:pyridoxine/pyridoxamine 5'-phosphate oxidase
VTSPIEIIRENWKQAKSLGDANADFCTFATASENGQACLRTLVLRDITGESLVVFVNNTSPKWEQLEYSDKMEVLLFWPSLMQQYRIRGDLEVMPKEIIRQHWCKKPYESKIIDNFYSAYQPQSSTVESRESLLEDINKLKNDYPEPDDVPFPENAEGVIVRANYIETWHGSATDRIHDRCLYTLEDGQWEKATLVP